MNINLFRSPSNSNDVLNESLTVITSNIIRFLKIIRLYYFHFAFYGYKNSIKLHEEYSRDLNKLNKHG